MSLNALIGRLCIVLMVPGAFTMLPPPRAAAESTALGGSGWVASWDDALFDVRFEVNIEEPGLLAIRKIIDHTDFAPIPVTFTPTGPDAIPIIEVLEQLTNSTTSAWASYLFTLSSGAAEGANAARFDVAATDLGGAGGFQAAPFDSAVFGPGPVTQWLAVSGGAGVVPGAVWQPGGLVIDTRVGLGNLGGFTLTEGPAARDQTVIPSPAAAAMGLVLLAASWHRRP